ncbi:MAG: DUF555 domain-containing protein [Halobacteria archaeon]|nr:DUF555 domain-containing protein [Halobacteria archaeon]
MANYKVALEAGWVVEEVDDIDDAISVAVSEAGKQLNPDKDYVEVELGLLNCPACGEPFDSVVTFAGTALVGLVFEIDVYNAENEEHAAKIAKKEVGEAIRDVPLEVAEVVEEDES